MSISISNYPVHLQDGFKPNRECLKSQGSQSEYQKVFHRDSLEVSQLSKNREILMDKIKHTVVQSAASLSDMRAGILKEIREEKGQYGYSDVVNACGLSYARLYSEIEQRYENEQYYKVDGTPLTKEDIFAHAASLHQGFPHCAIFPTAASRRSLGRVSVPMWPITLSGRLLIVALVGRYPSN